MSGSQDYRRLTWQDFAVQLVESKDLDPVYVMLSKAEMEPGKLKRWLLAYWCFYHSGVASWIADHDKWMFFEACRTIYKEAPRGFERRHFRGDNGKKALKWLEEFGDSEQIVEWIVDEGPQNFADVSERVQQMYLFGPWIAWKVADMLERVAGAEIDFSGADLAIYEEPRKGAALILRGDPEANVKPEEVRGLIVSVEHLLVNYYAPPSGDRPINIQEVETIFCKYKAHVNGHYPLFNDSRELKASLDGWGEFAESLAPFVPEVPEGPATLKLNFGEWNG